MGIFGKSSDEDVFYPNCKPVQGSSEGRIVLQCRPKLQHNGKVLQGDRDTEIILEEGQQAIVTDDGGISEDMLAKLTTHIEKSRLHQ